MQELKLMISFTKGYCAHPYWPAREKVINIQKESGTKRARSETKRIQALRDYLDSKDMTTEYYEDLVKQADRQFYTTADMFDPQGHEPNEIVIPGHQWYGALANASFVATKSIRVCTAEQIRTELHVGDLFTGKTKGDGLWERFVVVKLGVGTKLSNQRALRSNEYIKDFSAPLTISFNDEIDYKKVANFMAWCGREIGVGASRKLGWGRFTVAIVSNGVVASKVSPIEAIVPVVPIKRVKLAA